jgi:mono/diheme cytochrome c family protein
MHFQRLGPVEGKRIGPASQQRQFVQAKRVYCYVLGCLLGLSLLGIATKAQDASQSRGDKASKDTIARGKYIVEGVAMCSQCHTPHDNAGDPDRGKWLQGGPVWLVPAMPVSDWPLKAPRIAGLLPGSDADVITLLTTGVWRDGRRPRPPMPQFRMSREDAAAVAAYLKSLSASSSE